jgi:hypothetical protein
MKTITSSRFRLVALASAHAAHGRGICGSAQPAWVLEYEPSYHEGKTVILQIPSATSTNPNQAHFACFALGPDLSKASRSASAPTLYVILAPGATQVACPDGTLRHDHVLSAVPGSRGYTGAWTIVLALPARRSTPRTCRTQACPRSRPASPPANSSSSTPGSSSSPPVVGGR